MDITNWVYKHFIILTIIFIGCGISADLFLTDAKIILEPIEHIDTLTGEKTLINNYKFERVFVLFNSISGICYSIAISIFILVFLDKKFDKQLSEQTEELQRQREEEHRKEIDKLNDKIYKNVFNGVLKKVIPEQLFDKFNKDIFETDLVRKNAYWTYEVIKNQHSSFDVKQSIRYELHNLNDFDVEPILPLNINSTLSFVKSQLTSIKVFNSNKLEQTLFNKDNKKISIPKNDYVEISMIVDNEYYQPCVLDVHNSLFSIIGLTIETIQPSDVNVKIHPSFVNKLTKIETGLTTSTKYQPIDCILQGQGVSYTIELVNDVTTNTGDNRMLKE